MKSKFPLHIVERQTNIEPIMCHPRLIHKTAQKMCQCLPFSMFERGRMGCWMPAPQATNGVTVSWSMPVPWEPQSVIPWSLVYTNTVLPSSRKYLYRICTQNLYISAHLINAIASTGSLYSNYIIILTFSPRPRKQPTSTPRVCIWSGNGILPPL
jgi:hypothetical protein